MQVKYEQVPKQRDSSFYCHVRSGDAFPFDMHCHPEYELLYFTCGSGKMYVIDSVIGYQQGDIFLFSPNTPHTCVSNSPANEAIVVQFVHDFLGGEFWQNKDVENIQSLLEQSKAGLHFTNVSQQDFLQQLYEIPKQAGFQRLLCLLDVLNGLAKLSEGRKRVTTKQPDLPKQSESLLKVLNYVHSHLSEEVTAERAAKLIEMSVSGFTKFFKRNMQHPFNDYVIDMRIEKACELLTGSDQSVLEICYSTGFNNLSNFNRQFKKRKNMSPRQYRKTFSDQNDSIDFW